MNWRHALKPYLGGDSTSTVEGDGWAGSRAGAGDALEAYGFLGPYREVRRKVLCEGRAGQA
jgi:hypothetical protein